MRIKHFIVTYNNNTLLHKAIESIFSAPTDHDRSVFVISNHSRDEYVGPHPVTVLRNETRPDFSTGHLSRNWNQAIINGFVDIKSPKADLLILSQNDCVFEPGYVDRCVEHHTKYDIVTYGIGDNCVSYSPNAIARIGLWDERFCNIGFQEADYFLRAAIYLGDRASINDGIQHGRVHNPISDVGLIVRPEATGFQRRDEAHLHSMRYHVQSRGLFFAKWDSHPEKWGPDFRQAAQRLNNFIYYPYFEMNVETLVEQRYLAFF